MMQFLTVLPYAGVYFIVGFAWLMILLTVGWFLYVGARICFKLTTPQVNLITYSTGAFFASILLWVLCIWIGHRLIGGWFHP